MKYIDIINQKNSHKKHLEIKNLEVSYGFIKAIKDISLDFEPGKIFAILGSNGAGKTTLIKSISGLVKSEGLILLNGEKINNLSPHKISKMGLSLSPEGRMIVNDLTVGENLELGTFSLSKKIPNYKKVIKDNYEMVYKYFPVLKERINQQASTLSGGEQQMLAIGRALMSNPDILLLDEPSLGLAPLIVAEIFSIISKIRDSGKTIIIVEQNALQTLKIADYAYVLELGKISKQGKSKDLLADKSLVESYLGG